MIELEKVIKAIEGCVFHNHDCVDCDYDGCVFKHGDCRRDLLADTLDLLKAQPEIEHIEKDVTYPADMLTPGDVMASIGFNEQIAGHIGEMLLENGAVRIETFEEYEGPYHMVRFHLSADVIKQKKEGKQE